MVITIYFLRHPKDDLQEWKFIYPEFDISKLTDNIAEVYKLNYGAIIEEITIRRI